MNESDSPLFLHVTTVHVRDDVRIRYKMAKGLSAISDARVALLVFDGRGDENDEGLLIHDLGRRPRSRMMRFLIGSWRFIVSVRKFRPSITHFHDPELILAGCLLSISGYAVIYDVHEDLPRQIASKYWVPRFIRKAVSLFAEGLEWLGGVVLSGIVAATPTIADRFPEKKTIVVQNYPLLSEFPTSTSTPMASRSRTIAYIGGIARVRGAFQIVDVMPLLPDVRLKLAGKFIPESLRIELESRQGWKRVEYMGWLGREGVSKLLEETRVGLVLLHPTDSYLESLPVKMFEYMASGIPMVVSDFPLWRRILSDFDCAIFVDPFDLRQVAEAVEGLVNNPERAEVMGVAGRQAIESKYNWESELIELDRFYRNLTA